MLLCGGFGVALMWLLVGVAPEIATKQLTTLLLALEYLNLYRIFKYTLSTQTRTRTHLGHSQTQRFCRFGLERSHIGVHHDNTAMLFVILARIVSVTPNSLMYLLMFEQVRLLSKRFGANITTERFLARMRTQVDLDVALIEKTPITYTTPMHGLLFP